MVEYKPIGNNKSCKNTCHPGRHKKGLLMRPERNEKIYSYKQIKLNNYERIRKITDYCS